MAHIDHFFQALVEWGASDLHLAEGQPPKIRRNGEIVPIREVDDHEIGEPGPITRQIQDKFRAIIEGRDDEFGHYMEYARG